MNDNYKFVPLGKPTKYPIYDNGKRAIPAGTDDVEIAYGASSRTYTNSHTGKVERQNVYRWRGQIYNA